MNMILVRQLLWIPMRNTRAYRNLVPVFGGAVITALFVVFHYNPVPSFPPKLRKFALPWKEPNDAAEHQRPRAFYPWISDSGQTLNGTKPPVYGVFVLIDLNFQSYVTSQPDGNPLIERVTNHDFGFSSCHQVRKATLCNAITVIA